MTQKALVAVLAGLIGVWLVADCGGAVASSDRAAWSYSARTAFDTFIQTFPLATTDTTETITELNAAITIDGRSARRATHRWLVRADLSGGTELMRQRLEAGYRFRHEDGLDRLRLDATWFSRQYNQDTEYTLSSNNREGRFEARLVPAVGFVAWDVRGGMRYVDYQTPSTLEQDRFDTTVATFLRSTPDREQIWGVGVRGIKRVYPDTMSISSDIVAVEGDFESGGLYGEGMRAYHRSEKRLIRDESVRPSAWSHWTDLRATVSLGPGQVILDLENEVWQYDYETSAYFDSWRATGFLGYRMGSLMKLTWHAGVVAEFLEAGSSPEAYQQLGGRVGIESYGGFISGSVSVEHGMRYYSDDAFVLPSSGLDDLEGFEDELELDYLNYSDFHYWAIWALGTLQFTKNFSLEILANYQPERHTERTDDTALGYASVRLVWRH